MVTAAKRSVISDDKSEALQQIYHNYKHWSEGVKERFDVGVVGFLELLRDAREKKEQNRPPTTTCVLCHKYPSPRCPSVGEK